VRVHGYGRVSTSEQGVSGLGLDAQRHAVVQAAEQRGWGPVCWHQDTASGASLQQRPALAALLDRLDRDGGTLVVAKLDRLSRSVSDLAQLLARAQQRGWTLVLLDTGVDTTTPAGGLVAHVVAATAQYERELIAARTRDALAQARARGVRLGRPVLLPDAVRTRIADDRAAGLSLRQIADQLTDEQVPTAQGGARWHASTVAAVLRSLDQDQQVAA
jgi:DNA invertase Pin-like site-specific DNA recombinase